LRASKALKVFVLLFYNLVYLFSVLRFVEIDLLHHIAVLFSSFVQKLCALANSARGRFVNLVNICVSYNNTAKQYRVRFVGDLM
jgi:hypothetical protein